MPEDRLGVASASSGVVGELDPAGLAAAACQHLRLDDDLAAQLLGGRPGFLGRLATRPSETGIPRGRRVLPLVLVEIHGRRASLAKP